MARATSFDVYREIATQRRHSNISFDCKDLQAFLIDTAEELDTAVPAELWSLVGEYAAPSVAARCPAWQPEMYWTGKYTRGLCASGEDSKVTFESAQIDHRFIVYPEIDDFVADDAETREVLSLRTAKPTCAMFGTPGSYRRVNLQDYKGGHYLYEYLDTLSRNHLLYEESVKSSDEQIIDAASIIAIKKHKWRLIYDELECAEQLATVAGIQFKPCREY